MEASLEAVGGWDMVAAVIILAESRGEGEEGSEGEDGLGTQAESALFIYRAEADDSAECECFARSQ